ncbi:hypothetical protein [Streptomyces sp. NPDC007369]|uniref:hypothetical protein n=1 Tax=Streptomyces sp. NPDC007369 TaxID=3154589 RepID=UPI0033D5B2F4
MLHTPARTARRARLAVPAAVSAALLGGCLLAVAAPAAQAAPAGYSPSCRAEVAKARTWLTKVGRDPRTDDPVVVHRKLEEARQLVAGQVARQVAIMSDAVARRCLS